MALTSIFHTIECDAWANDLMYDDYVNLCKAAEVSPVAAKVYYVICAALDCQHCIDNYDGSDPQ